MGRTTPKSVSGVHWWSWGSFVKSHGRGEPLPLPSPGSVSVPPWWDLTKEAPCRLW